ncbi:MAG: chromate resistance protein [Gammaproteobacteria bacterium]|nr:chromate resistance protein [Gammaproteobacteria bacterium]MDE2250118.1 chromate resistance protein [Gammaproteobacteria bacterium]
MSWLLLVTNLTGAHQSRRVRIWRALKAAGAAPLRDGVYVLPVSETARRVFEEQRQELEGAAGTAHVIEFASTSGAQEASLRNLFDRSDDYAKFLAAISAGLRQARRPGEAEARRRLNRLTRDLASLTATDFFDAEARQQAEAALADLTTAVESRFSAAEPHAVKRAIQPVDRKHYRGRTWVTRERLWIDRVCSAWLIRRFIDPKAKFVWVKKIADCPKSAVGFDYDGAQFTHVGARVTFEVLLASFGLEADAALVAIGALVHYLDVGGVPVPEAAGFAAVVTGARTLHADDHALLTALSPVIDSLYAAHAARKES